MLTLSLALQAYHYMQRPAPILSTMGLHGPGGDFRMLDPAGRMVSGAPIALGSGRMKAVLFPSFAVSTCDRLHSSKATLSISSQSTRDELCCTFCQRHLCHTRCAHAGKPAFTLHVLKL